MNEFEDGAEYCFTARTIYPQIACNTEIKFTTRTENLVTIIEDFAYFLKGVGFSQETIDEYIKV